MVQWLGIRPVSPCLRHQAVDDIRLRRALNLGRDKEGDRGGLLQRPPTGLLSQHPTPGLLERLEAIPDSSRSCFDYNPDKAKKLLAEGASERLHLQVRCAPAIPTTDLLR